MRISITNQFVRQRLTEGSQAAFAVKFYDDSADTWTLSTPTTVRYRVDNPDTGSALIDWTTVTADDELTISLDGSSQLLQDQCNAEEPRVLTVRADNGLSTQCQAVAKWSVVNAMGTL